MLYCKKCENLVQKGETTCQNCGAIFKVSKTPHFFQKIIVTLVLIVMVVCLFFYIDFLVTSNKASYKSKQKAVIGSLHGFGQDEEDYKSVFKVYGTIDEVARSRRIDLRQEKYGYVFMDLMERPDENFYAILASPKKWGKYRDSHYIMTNTGVVRKWPEKELPFGKTLPADKSSIEKIEKLQDAIKYFVNLN